MNIATICVAILVLVIYICLGGVGFHFLEGENEKEVAEDVLLRQVKFLENNTCIDKESFKALITAVITAYDQGALVMDNETSTDNSWNIYNAIYFSTTVVTTIGYGHVSPSTLGGRIFLVVFALIGIPLFLMITGALASGYAKIMRKWHRSMTNPSCSETPCCACWKLTAAVIITAFNISLYFVIPSIIFHFVETDWSFATAFYYSFVTLTTIGFGDYVAGYNADESYANWYRILLAVWILFGLMWVGSVISQIQESLTNYFEKKENEKEAFKKEQQLTLKAPPPGRNRTVNNVENGASPMNGGYSNAAYQQSTQL